MSKSVIAGLVVAAAIAAGGGTFAMRELSPKVAEIVSVDPITVGMEQQYAEVIDVEEIVNPDRPRLATVTSALPLTQTGPDREVCENVVVTRKAAVKDENQIAGTATGAIIGAALGNQVGDGKGKKAATAVGAILGGVVGKKVQTDKQNNATYQTTEQRCHVEPGLDEITGYKVTYELDGRKSEILLDSSPDKELVIANGQVVSDKTEARKIMKNQAPSSYTVSYKHGRDEGSVSMPTAPKIGALLVMQEGKVVTDSKLLASIGARQHEVIAYKVNYKIGNTLSDVRMTEKPEGNTLTIANGKVVFPETEARQ